MKEETIAQFASSLRGPVIGRSSAEYEEARKLYNGMIDKRPLIIARCADVGDVIAAVNFGRDNKLPIAIRGGGHNGPGLGSVNDGLVIDLSTMKGVRVDPQQKTVRVGPGCTTGDVDHANSCIRSGRPLRDCLDDRCTRLALSGGHGYLSRQYGLAVDSLIQSRRGSGRRQFRHRLRDRELGLAMGIVRRRRKLRRRHQLPLSHPSGGHDLWRTDHLRFF